MWRILCICLILAALLPAQTKIDIVNQTFGNLPGARVNGAVASATAAASATSATTATTAGALSANPTNCSAGQAAGGIAANGNAEDCFTPSGGGSSITRTAVTHSATPTYTRSSAIQQFTQTLTSSVTSSTLSGASAGDLLSFELTQDGTGSRTWAGPTGFPSLTLCSTANSKTTVQYFWTGSAAIRRSYDVAGCTERVLGWEDGTASTFPAGSHTVVTLADTQTLTGKTLVPTVLRLPNSITLPGTCTVGDVYFDTDATSGQRVYGCESTNTWVLQGGGGGGGSGIWSVIVGCPATLSAGATDWCGPQRAWAGAEQNAMTVIQKTGTLSKLRLIPNGTLSNNITCTVRTGTLGSMVSSSVVASLAAGATGGQAVVDNTNTVAVTAGQMLTLQCANTTATAQAMTWMVEVN